MPRLTASLASASSWLPSSSSALPSTLTFGALHPARAMSLAAVRRPSARAPSLCPTCTVHTTRMSTFAVRPTLARQAPTLDRTPVSSTASPQPDVVPAPPLHSPPQVQKTRQRTIKARKAAINLTPTAVDRIKSLLESPEPKLIRVGVRNKGCAGMSYHLEYVDKPERFDEIVEQDGVKVVVDSKALFSIIGSTMDWQEDALQAKFVFKNPNIKDACGCGESFIV